MLAKHALSLLRLPGHFCSSYFGDGFLRTICVSWPLSMIFLMLACEVAKIIAVSHWCLVGNCFVKRS
jgi:hypothetical protein